MWGFPSSTQSTARGDRLIRVEKQNQPKSSRQVFVIQQFFTPLCGSTKAARKHSISAVSLTKFRKYTYARQRFLH
jgi:hypothetical protein